MSKLTRKDHLLMAKALKKAKWLIKNGDEWAICFALERLAQQDEISELTLDHCKQWIQKQLGKGKSIYFYEEWVQTHHYETYKTMAFSNESSLSLFTEYERLFKTLASGTILYNNWK